MLLRDNKVEQTNALESYKTNRRKRTQEKTQETNNRFREPHDIMRQ